MFGPKFYQFDVSQKLTHFLVFILNDVPGLKPL